MASSITLSADSLEGQIMESIMGAQNLEGDETANPNNENRITANINTDNMTLSFTGNLPLVMTIGANGMPQFAVEPYLSDAA